MRSASFVPLVKRLFRRPSRSKPDAGESDPYGSASNSTEYAFQRSQSILSRLLASVRGQTGRLASVAFFVFAVLYVFQNEVSLQVARTVGRRLKRLSAKVESGDEELSERDMQILGGWRWRILLWKA